MQHEGHILGLGIIMVDSVHSGVILCQREESSLCFAHRRKFEDRYTARLGYSSRGGVYARLQNEHLGVYIRKIKVKLTGMRARIQWRARCPGSYSQKGDCHFWAIREY
jgi:hypothetical protein